MAEYEIGDIKKAAELGKKGNGRYIYSACAICGKGSYREMMFGQPRHPICRSCNLKRLLLQRKCILCNQFIQPGRGKEVVIHGLHGTQEGRVHLACWQKHRDRLQTEQGEKANSSFRSRERANTPSLFYEPAPKGSAV